MKPVSLDLHIGELVLDGLQGVGHTQVGAAVERELGRLVANHGIPPSLERSRAVASLDGGSFEVSSSPGAATVGEQIARAVYRGQGR